MLKTKKGMVLPLVIVVLVVISILGIVILQIALAQNKHAARDKSSMQAFYLARSGVEAAEVWLMENTDKFSDIKNIESTPSSLEGSEINGTFTITVTGNLDSTVLIEGTGTVNGVKATAAKALISYGDILDLIVFDDTVYAKKIVTLNGGVTIDGTVAYGEDIIENGAASTITGGPAVKKDKILPPPIFPADPNSASDLTLNSSVYLNELGLIDEDDSADVLYVVKDFYFNKHKRVLTIDTGDAGEVVRLVTRNFNFVTGSLRLIGNGSFELYVTNSMSLGANAFINASINDDDVVVFGSAKQFLVLLGKGASFSMTGSPLFCGCIYGPEANVSISGDQNFCGTVVGGTTTLSGNPFASSGDAINLTFEDLPIIFFEESHYINN
jgi:type II secretory pathway pseudopilin PulG